MGDNTKYLETLKTLHRAASGEAGNTPNREEARVALEYAIRLAEADQKQGGGNGDQFEMSAADDFLARVLAGRPSAEQEWLNEGALTLSRMISDESTTPDVDSAGARWLADQIKD